MSPRTASLPLTLLCSLLFAACGTEPTDDPASQHPEVAESPAAVPDEAPPASPVAEAEEAVGEDAFPLPEDFEEEATASITAENLEQELAALEAELSEQ